MWIVEKSSLVYGTLKVSNQRDNHSPFHLLQMQSNQETNIVSSTCNKSIQLRLFCLQVCQVLDASMPKTSGNIHKNLDLISF